jgi:hypothetical protein
LINAGKYRARRTSRVTRFFDFSIKPTPSNAYDN